MTDVSFNQSEPKVAERPRLVAEPFTPSESNVAEPPQALGHIAAPSTLRAEVPTGLVAGTPRPPRPSKKSRRGNSFIGGFLIGSSLSLPVVALEAGEGGSPLVLVGVLALAIAGIGMHLRGAKQVSTSRRGSLVAQVEADAPRTPESP